MTEQKKRQSSVMRWVIRVLLSLYLVVLSFTLGYRIGINHSENPSWLAEWIPNVSLSPLAPGLQPLPQRPPSFSSPRPFSSRLIQRLGEVYERLRQYFYEPKELKEEELTYGAIQGLLRATGDRFTRYLKPSDLEQFQFRSKGEYEGIGAELSMMMDPATGKEHLTVMGIFPERPADKAGLRPLDRIIKINGKPTDGMTLEQAISLIRGRSGTKVTLTVRREGVPEPFDITITRQRIKIPILRKKMLPGKIGYIRLLEFNEKSAQELSKALDELEAQGAKALILDLRDNPGGLLDAAVAVASLFVPGGKTVVMVKSRMGGEQKIGAIPAFYKGWGKPIAVIINRWSASASEIVAGALKDHGIALVIGEKTFGKASIQTVIPLQGGGALVITTGSYLTPSGYDIHANKGLEPTVKLEPAPEEKAHTTRLAALWVKRGKEHLRSEELQDAIICFSRARDLDEGNKEAILLWEKALQRLMERRRHALEDSQLEQVRQLLLERLEGETKP